MTGKVNLLVCVQRARAGENWSRLGWKATPKLPPEIILRSGRLPAVKGQIKWVTCNQLGWYREEVLVPVRDEGLFIFSNYILKEDTNEKTFTVASG